MAESRTGTDDEEAPASPATPGGPAAGARTGLVLAVVLVLGLTVGAVTVGLLSDAAPPPASASGDLPADGGLLPDVPLPTTTTRFEVNAPCLRAVNAAQDAYAAVDELGEAAAALDAARLDEVVRRLQPLQEQLEADLAACQVTPVDDPPGGAPPPATTPTAPTPTG
ncbi:hypothetical protein E4P41_06770 [Geodermatophilus sp. DF01-2]|uniref:hypothetical protein n=1 Tax=Geodermatophilus sp. DF01-2 TaxID=2559610 RepID=UPI0010748708|nr:hypothetical protein [Geodermatophilus sp. DF01_2]TFV62615.1 hypothetical protein E4P41_06770 [Geodermatophilus sp. DF01_2]